MKTSDLNKKLKTWATKVELKVEQDKIVKLQTQGLTYSLGESMVRFQIMFVYQPTLDTLESKEGKGTDCVIGWESNEVYTSKLTPWYTALLRSIKLSGYRIRMRFDNSSLTVEQNNYATEIVNGYVVYDLDTWPKISLNSLS